MSSSNSKKPETLFSFIHSSQIFPKSVKRASARRNASNNKLLLFFVSWLESFFEDAVNKKLLNQSNNQKINFLVFISFWFFDLFFFCFIQCTTHSRNIGLFRFNEGQNLKLDIIVWQWFYLFWIVIFSINLYSLKQNYT